MATTAVAANGSSELINTAVADYMSSAPVLPSGLTEFFFGECTDKEDAGRYQLQWDIRWTKVTKNKEG